MLTGAPHYHSEDPPCIEVHELWWGTKNNIFCYFHLLSCAKQFKTTSWDKSTKYQGAASLMGNLEPFPGSKRAQRCKWADTATPAHAPWTVTATMTLLHTSQRIPGKYLSTKPANFSFKAGDVEKELWRQ